MALTLQQRRELLRQRQASSGSKAVTGTPSASVQSSRATAKTLKERLVSVRSTQTKIINEARAKAEAEALAKPTPIRGENISAPRENDSLIRKEDLANKHAQNMRDFGAPVRNFIRDKTAGSGLLFGQNEAEFFGQVTRPKNENEGFFRSIAKDVNSRGILRGLLYEKVLQTPEERVSNNYAEMKKMGYSEKEALTYSQDFVNGKTSDIPEEALSQMRYIETGRKSWAVVELLDGYPLFRAARLNLSKTFLRSTIESAMLAESANSSRKILMEAVPSLRGTQELEEVISSIRAVADPVRGEQVLRNIADTTNRTRVESTEAQRVFYENGIPIIKGGDVPPTTISRGGRQTPDFTADALSLRKEINDALAGSAEAGRLSNANILADEIKAGALPLKTTPDKTVKLFASDEIADVTRLRAGDRLATSKEVLESTLESGKAKTLEVLPDDVIRLSDGTFVYAPKKQIAKGVQATVRSLRESQRRKVLDIEKSVRDTRLVRDLAREEAKFDSRLLRKERAAEISARKSEKVRYAREVLQNGEKYAKQTIDEIEAKRVKALEQAIESRKKAQAAIAEEKKKMKSLLRNLAKVKKQRSETPSKFAKKIDRLRNRVKKPTAAEIKKVQAEKSKLLKDLLKSERALVKQIDSSKSKIQQIKEANPDLSRKLTDIKADVNRVPNALKKGVEARLRKEVSEAKATISKLETARERETIVKAKARNKARTTQLAEKLQENYTEASKSLVTDGDLTETAIDVVRTSAASDAGKAIEPVQGDGKEVASKIIKGLTDEYDSIKRLYEERGISLADLPDTHQAIGNKALLKQAFSEMIADPYKVYNDFVSGVLPDNTTRAAYGLALMKSDFVLNNPTRMDSVVRAFVKGNSRIGQELQSIKVFGKMDFINIMARFNQQADELLKARGIKIEDEAKKLMKLFDNEIDEVKTIAKNDVAKAINDITCKVE